MVELPAHARLRHDGARRERDEREAPPGRVYHVPCLARVEHAPLAAVLHDLDRGRRRRPRPHGAVRGEPADNAQEVVGMTAPQTRRPHGRRGASASRPRRARARGQCRPCAGCSAQPRASPRAPPTARLRRPRPLSSRRRRRRARRRRPPPARARTLGRWRPRHRPPPPPSAPSTAPRARESHPPEGPSAGRCAPHPTPYGPSPSRASPTACRTAYQTFTNPLLPSPDLMDGQTAPNGMLQKSCVAFAENRCITFPTRCLRRPHDRVC